MITVDEFLELGWRWESHWPQIEAMRYGTDTFMVRHASDDVHIGFINGRNIGHADNMERTVRLIYTQWRRIKQG